MNKVIFIIPYFGKFNNYFQLFLNSCQENPFYQWLIFTDDHTPFQYPKNVTVYYTSWEEIRRLIQSKFDFSINLEKPYKLCDYKPAYGFILEEYIQGYDWWGFCDTDLIWGNLSKWLTQEKLISYDKIGVLGHCTIFRNTKEDNRLFMKPVNGNYYYRKVFQSHESQHFDEQDIKSINTIFNKYQKKIYTNFPIADIYTKGADFRLVHYQGSNREQIDKAISSIFVWDRGKLERYFVYRNNLVSLEYMYIHLQKRKMKLDVDSDCEKYKIIADAFEPLEVNELTKETFLKVKKRYWTIHFFAIRWQFFKMKLYKLYQKFLKIENS